MYIIPKLVLKFCRSFNRDLFEYTLARLLVKLSATKDDYNEIRLLIIIPMVCVQITRT